VAADRRAATRFGGKAVELVLVYEVGLTVANHPPDIGAVQLAGVVGRTK
jgi:hypothetical protein